MDGRRDARGGSATRVPSPRRAPAGWSWLLLVGLALAAGPASAHVPDGGDAPADYPTVWHDYPREQLGPVREVSTAARETPPWTGSADDDGVFFNDPDRSGDGRLVKGETAEIVVDFRNLEADSAFGIWFDWNQDESWTVAERRVWAGAGPSATPPDGPIADGLQAFHVDIPEAPNADDEIQVRVRVWSATVPDGKSQALNPDAPRADKVACYGEVEDYLVPLDPPPPPDLVFADGFESGDLGAWTTASP